MKLYHVYCNNKPAVWGKTMPVFADYNEARKYLEVYLDWWSVIGIDSIPLNTPYDYNGYGDTIEIREVEY